MLCLVVLSRLGVMELLMLERVVGLKRMLMEGQRHRQMLAVVVLIEVLVLGLVVVRLLHLLSLLLLPMVC